MLVLWLRRRAWFTGLMRRLRGVLAAALGVLLWALLPAGAAGAGAIGGFAAGWMVGDLTAADRLALAGGYLAAVLVVSGLAAWRLERRGGGDRARGGRRNGRSRHGVRPELRASTPIVLPGGGFTVWQASGAGEPREVRSG